MVYVDLVLKETGHIRHILKESGLEKGKLAVKARNLSDLVDEVQNTGRNIDHFDAHNFEELPK